MRIKFPGGSRTTVSCIKVEAHGLMVEESSGTSLYFNIITIYRILERFNFEMK